MTQSQEALLLTVARIMRARLKEEIFDPAGQNKSDYEALNEALIPFDPTPATEAVANMMAKR